jgi:hypothetical protein
MLAGKAQKGNGPAIIFAITLPNRQLLASRMDVIIIVYCYKQASASRFRSGNSNY